MRLAGYSHMCEKNWEIKKDELRTSNFQLKV